MDCVKKFRYRSSRCSGGEAFQLPCENTAWDSWLLGPSPSYLLIAGCKLYGNV